MHCKSHRHDTTGCYAFGTAYHYLAERKLSIDSLKLALRCNGGAAARLVHANHSDAASAVGGNSCLALPGH